MHINLSSFFDVNQHLVVVLCATPLSSPFEMRKNLFISHHNLSSMFLIQIILGIKKARYLSTLQFLQHIFICYLSKFDSLYFLTSQFLLQYPQFSFHYLLMLLQHPPLHFALMVYPHFCLLL